MMNLYMSTGNIFAEQCTDHMRCTNAINQHYGEVAWFNARFIHSESLGRPGLLLPTHLLLICPHQDTVIGAAEATSLHQTCLTTFVVIRPTPVFPSLRIFSQALTLPCFFPVLISLILVPSEFPHACLAVHGWMPLISLFHLPATSTTDSEPCTTASTLPSILDSFWKISKDKPTTSNNSPNWKIPLIIFLPPQSFHASPDSAHTSLINKLCFSNPYSVLCLHLSPYLQVVSHLAMTVF